MSNPPLSTPLREFTIFWRGEQHVVRAADRMRAKIILYVAIRPESKWGEIR